MPETEIPFLLLVHQRCQLVYWYTKIPILVYVLLKALEWKTFVYILWSFGILKAIWFLLWPFGAGIL
jgi:hypothetical protein